ncbi:hypothetical protein ES705_30234 [subsurface metagenome]
MTYIQALKYNILLPGLIRISRLTRIYQESHNNVNAYVECINKSYRLSIAFKILIKQVLLQNNLFYIMVIPALNLYNIHSILQV